MDKVVCVFVFRGHVLKCVSMLRLFGARECASAWDARR